VERDKWRTGDRFREKQGYPGTEKNQMKKKGSKGKKQEIS